MGRERTIATFTKRQETNFEKIVLSTLEPRTANLCFIAKLMVCFLIAGHIYSGEKQEGMVCI